MVATHLLSKAVHGLGERGGVLLLFFKKLFKPCNLSFRNVSVLLQPTLLHL